MIMHRDSTRFTMHTLFLYLTILQQWHVRLQGSPHHLSHESSCTFWAAGFLGAPPFG